MSGEAHAKADTHWIRRMGEHHSLSARFGEQNNLFPLPEFEPWTLQPVASRNTDYAIPTK